MKAKRYAMAGWLVCVAWLGAGNALAFYNPSTGRWLSRDPIEERGGRNSYAYVRNVTTSRHDRLGLIDGTTVPRSPAALWNLTVPSLPSQPQGGLHGGFDMWSTYFASWGEETTLWTTTWSATFSTATRSTSSLSIFSVVPGGGGSVTAVDFTTTVEPTITSGRRWMFFSS
jgi:uncharacterized protein RhaS with RHS repeats